MTSRTDVVKNDTNPLTERKEAAVLYSLAFERAQSRRHRYIVLGICGLIISSVSAPGSSLLQARHAITCNLMIDYDQQMRINLYTFVALITGGPLIAVSSDSTSRLKPLVVSVILYGLATMVLGFCTEYYCFASLSAFRALWASGLLALTTVYVAEIQTPRYRGPGLCCLQIFWLIGLVLTSVLPIPWRASQFFFGSLDLVLGVLAALFFAESPRLLLSLGKNEAAAESLRKIHARSSRSREAEWPVKNLVDDFSSEAQSRIKLRTYIPKALRPPWYSLLIVLQIQFVFNLCHFTMSYWFREINSRHVLIFPKIARQGYCKLGDKYLPANLRAHKKNGSSFDPITSRQSTEPFDSSCVNPVDIDPDYYKAVLTLALTTLPVLIWMILRLDHLGRSYFTTLSHAVAGLSSFCVHFLIGTRHELLYAVFMESMWVISGTASSCLVTEIFKTRVRVLGVGLANGFGYVGTAMGMYGLLLGGGAGCILVISMTGILLTAAGLLTLSLPDVVGVYLK